MFANNSRVSSRTFIAVAALVGVSLLGACSSTATDETSQGNEPAATTAATGVQLVEPDQFQSATDSGAEIIDVRTPAEFAEGHIEGAVNIDLNGPDFTGQIDALDPAKTYAVYCRSGNRSAAATQYMQDQGFASVYELGGGILSWQSAGLPVV